MADRTVLIEMFDVLRLTSKVFSSGYPSEIPILTVHWKKQATLWNVVRIYDDRRGPMQVTGFPGILLNSLFLYTLSAQGFSQKLPNGALSCGHWKVLPVRVRLKRETEVKPALLTFSKLLKSSEMHQNKIQKLFFFLKIQMHPDGINDVLHLTRRDKKSSRVEICRNTY
jgi:hypothetical protein